MVVKIEGDKDHPLNKGLLCVKGLASLELLYHQDRLKSPLKRVGRRGTGSWKSITWDEALTLIARELNKAKRRYGPHSVAFIHGAAKGLQDSYLARFANAFGSPLIGKFKGLVVSIGCLKQLEGESCLIQPCNDLRIH